MSALKIPLFTTQIVFAAVLFAAIPQDEPDPIDANGLATTETGLRYKVLVQGENGPRPNPAATVKVKYTAYHADGTVFDSSDNYGSAVSFIPCRALPWWVDGLQRMTVGSKFKFIIPPHLAYGEKGNPPHVPPNATLIFDVELVEFEQGPELPVFRGRVPGSAKKTPSGLIYEVLKPGEGKAPVEGDLVDVNYAVWTTTGRLVDCSEMLGRPMRFSVGKKRIRILNEGAKLLRPGGRCRFEAPAARAYGSRGFGNLVKSDTVTVWELELVKFVERPEFRIPPEEGLVTTASGLKYHEVKEGTGAAPEMGDTVFVDYAGWLEDGTQFDSSFKRGETAEFEIGRVIKGWNEGLQLMKEGAIHILIVPPELGYGARGAGAVIPPRATLVFYVELLQVEE